MPGPLLFKGGTALRKCIFGSTGRFSQDIDLDATHKNGFEETVEAAFQPSQPYYGIEFSLPHFRYSSDDNFSGTVEYPRHAIGPARTCRSAGGDIFETVAQQASALRTERPIARGGAVGGIVEVRLCQQLDQLILHVRAQLATSGAGVAARISAPESSAMVDAVEIASSYQGYSTRVATSQITSKRRRWRVPAVHRARSAKGESWRHRRIRLR